MRSAFVAALLVVQGHAAGTDPARAQGSGGMLSSMFASLMAPSPTTSAVEACVQNKQATAANSKARFSADGYATSTAYEACVSSVKASAPAAVAKPVAKPQQLLQPGGEAADSSMSWSGMVGLLGDWVQKNLAAADKAETWSAYLANEKSLLTKSPKAAMGGKLLEMSAWRSAYASAVEGVAHTLDGDAITLATNWVGDMCSDHEMQAAYHATATEHPKLSLVLDDIIGRIEKIPKYASHPRKEELKACYKALGNTTGLKPYASHILNATRPSALQLFTDAFIR